MVDVPPAAPRPPRRRVRLLGILAVLTAVLELAAGLLGGQGAISAAVEDVRAVQ